VEGKVTSLTNFGAFLQIADEVEGMVHVGDLTNEKRLNHPNEVLKVGDTVKAQILEVDKSKRRLRLGVKQLQPTSVDEYIAEHKEGDVVTGRVADVTKGRIQVELGEGVRAMCALPGTEDKEESTSGAKADVSTLSSMLANKWKKGQADTSAPAKKEVARAGQVRTFRIIKLDPEKKRIEIEIVS
jgi:small subunit ribosomal protein S1